MQTDRATPNLPSRNFDATSRFYAALGFSEQYRDAAWMILTRGSVTLEFFPYPDLDPLASSFGCCIRVNDLASLYAVCQKAGIPDKTVGFPRLHPPRKEAWGGTLAALLDPDGSLLRLIQNPIDA
jgi:catechol 2,3-dioxygenase-like lactoylglutathione lyase family enzyme